VIVLDRPEALVMHGDWRTQLDHLELHRKREDGTVVDLLCFDPPFSSRTHKGHDAGPNADGVDRALLAYQPWRELDVERFVDAWAPMVRGWWCVLTDHVLARAWERELAAAGLYPFAPLPVVVPGQTVRRRGDGPSSCTTWLLVARPRNAHFAGWGTTRSDYRLPNGTTNDAELAGGKSTWVMTEIVSDYSRLGDVVCDPTCGHGTTGVAARALGRMFVGGDLDEGRARRAAQRIAGTREQLSLLPKRTSTVVEQGRLPEVG
jgi:hypothetical protein